MNTIVPGILLKDKKNIPSRKIKSNEGRVYKKRDVLENLIIEGYSEDKAMELAGYSEKNIQRNRSVILGGVNYDRLRLALKPGVIVINHMAIKVAKKQMEEKDIRVQAYGAKIAVDMGKLHLADDKSPTSITFSFQTIQAENVQVNVGKDDKDGSVKEIKDGDVG